MKKLIISLLLLVTVCSLCEGVMISPPIIKTKGRVGEILTEKITIRNDVDYDVYWRSFLISDSLTYIWRPPLDSVNSCHEWLRMPKEITGSFDLRIKIPEDAKAGGYWTSIVFTPALPKGEKGTLKFRLAICIPIFVQVEPCRLDLKICNLRYEAPYFIVEVKNIGEGIIWQLDANLVGFKRYEYKHTILPKGSRKIKIPLDLGGKDEVKVVIDFGGNFDIAGKLRISSR